MDDDSTELLIERSQQGDEQAFGLLVKMHYKRSLNVAYGVVRDEEDAKEVTQQSWVKVWKKLNTFQGNAHFTTWLFRIVSFTAIDFVRKKKRLAEVEYLEEIEHSVENPVTLAPSDWSHPAGKMAKDELKKQFHLALETMPEKHRTALTLREIEGMSYEEIAQIMECKIGTVMSRIYNARKSMQAKLKDLL